MLYVFPLWVCTHSDISDCPRRKLRKRENTYYYYYYHLSPSPLPHSHPQSLPDTKL